MSKKDPAVIKEEKAQKAIEASKRRQEEAITHKNAKLSRCTSFAYGRVTAYLFLAIGIFALSIAGIIIGILLMLEPETWNNGLALLIIGSILAVIGIAFSTIVGLKKRKALYQIPILAKQLELMTYEAQHPNESDEEKTKRLNKAKLYYEKLLANKAIRPGDCKKAIKTLHFPEPPKVPEKPLETREKE